MTKKSATEYIKKVNPKNVSGTIPQALDLIENLKKVKKDMNPRMVSAVGGSQLMGMLKHINSLFKKKKKPVTVIQEALETALQLEEELKLKTLQAQIKEFGDTINGD